MPTIEMLDRARKFIREVNAAMDLYRLIYEQDLQKWSMIHVEGSRSRLDLTECDVKHLISQPFEDITKKLQWNKSEMKDPSLPRALMLCYHLDLSQTRDKRIINQWTAMKKLGENWGLKSLYEAMGVLTDWITMKHRVYILLHNFAGNMEASKGFCDWGVDVLHRTFVLAFEAERQTLEEKSEPDTNVRSKETLDLMCDDCKKFSLKLIQSINKLAPHFRKILNEFYLNPEVADKQNSYIEAVKQCEKILRKYDLSFKIDIKSDVSDVVSDTKLLKLSPIFGDGFNKTDYSIYYKHTDEKGLLFSLTLCIEKPGQISDQEILIKDCKPPWVESVVRRALSYNFDEITDVYKSLMDQTPNVIKKSSESLQADVRKLSIVYESILSDFDEYFDTKNTHGWVIINECDVEHLNLQTVHSGLIENQSLEDTQSLPRALKLRSHIVMALTYQQKLKLLLNYLKYYPVSNEWEEEYGEEFCSVVVRMTSLRDKVNKALDLFAWVMENGRISLTWGKNSLYLACGLVAGTANLFIKGAKQVDVKRSEKEISLLCEDCKEFDLKSQKMLNKLSEHFRSIFREYYEDPESAKKSRVIRQALKKCQELLKEFGFSVKVSISDVVFDKDKPAPKSLSISCHLNIIRCVVYDTDRFPDKENKGLQLNIYFVRNLPNEKRSYDFNSSTPNSAMRIFLLK